MRSGICALLVYASCIGYFLKDFSLLAYFHFEIFQDEEISSLYHSI
jgi:hypothetical protein